MIYISKGIVQKNSTEDLLFVAYCGRTYQLTGIEAALWLNGRYSFAVSCKEIEMPALKHLVRMSLIEAESEDLSENRYRILSRCICCPTQYSKPELQVSYKESNILKWLRYAGIRLSVAELIYLQEYEILPEKHLLYEENRQSLVEVIYTKDNMADGLLEQQMEQARCRDKVVAILLKLLAKRKILLL